MICKMVFNIRPLFQLLILQEEQGFFRTRKFHGEDSNLDLFSTNLGLDFEDEDGRTFTFFNFN